MITQSLSSSNKQVVLLYAGINGYFEKVPVEAIAEFEKKVYQKLDTSYLELAKKIEEIKELTSEIEAEIKKLISEILKEGGFTSQE